MAKVRLLEAHVKVLQNASMELPQATKSLPNLRCLDANEKNMCSIDFTQWVDL